MNKGIIKLSIPKKPDYISIARLTTSGIANNMGLNYEQIEDIKVSIAEACINSLALNDLNEISLVFEVNKDKLIIRINGVKDSINKEVEDYKELELGLLIIKSLMDKVKFDEAGIEMIKYVEDDVNE